MNTRRAGRVAVGCLLLLAAACSREQQDWRSAEAADTIEGYGHFIERHPDSELATQARLRITQLGEDRDWERASTINSTEAYREFMAQHPNGKWAQEARIRIESFALGAQAQPAAPAAGSGEIAATGEAASSSGATPPPSGATPPPNEAPAAPSNDSEEPQPVGTGPAPTAEVGATGGLSGFGVQLGAFESEASAGSAWTKLEERFGPQLRGLHEQIVPASTPAGRIYRLQAAVENESRARAICAELRQHTQGCVPVLPP